MGSVPTNAGEDAEAVRAATDADATGQGDELGLGDRYSRTTAGTVHQLHGDLVREGVEEGVLHADS